MAVKKKAKAIKKKIEKIVVEPEKPALKKLTPEEAEDIKKKATIAKSGVDKAKDLVSKAENAFKFSKFGQLTSVDLVSKDGVWEISQPLLLDAISKLCKEFHEKKAVEYRDEAQKLIEALPV